MVGVKLASTEVRAIREVMDRLDCTSTIGRELFCLTKGILVCQVSIRHNET